jgi:hypothetical protein
MKKDMESKRHPARNANIAMCTLAIPAINAVEVNRNKHMMTLRINGITRIPPPGWRICATKDMMEFSKAR